MALLNLKTWVSCLTVALILLAFLMPTATDTYGGYLAILLILFLGVPHGATDHILFRHVKKDYVKGWLFRFFVRYFLLMGLFALTWWVLPSLALMIFLAISAYHFGQSQWHHLKSIKGNKNALYITWGAFVLAGPLLWNYTETAPIIKHLIGVDVLLSVDCQIFIPIVLVVLIVFQTVILYAKNKISKSKLLEEWAILLLFSVLFYSTTLLVGFAVYFVFWHSLDSVKDQLIKLREIHPDYTLKKYLRQIIPFTLLAFGSIGLFVWLSPVVLMTDAWISQFFILISIVTLPHSLLMDSFLEDKTKADIKQSKQKNKMSVHQVQAI
ncbi:MAG: Brp/Blh family beta-carotene 15,15'-monooxygenase [Saprospiraceae bacterium]|jgi:Brp/Blh family beta-carotene 15,15'-monooxygenase